MLASAAARLLQDPKAILAALRWPKFSLAAYTLVSRLKGLGVMPATIVDLGANVGQFAVAAAYTFPTATIFSVEPDPTSVLALRKNVAALGQVSILETAVGEAKGVATFFVNTDSQVSSLLPIGEARARAFPDSTVQKTIQVNVETLDNLFSTTPLSRPLLLKMDVQGAEKLVLNGASRFLLNTDWILTEVSFGGLYEGEPDFATLTTTLKGLGFDFLRPLNWHVAPESNQVIEMDALFRRR
jgi:FkbM family methyltransferase